MKSEPETPPRTWGRQNFLKNRLLKPRNTPTHVGKTGGPARPHSPSWKHPHARGEDWARGLPRWQEEETPPRTWGRRGIHPCRGLYLRNTPTHVGKTNLQSVRRFFWRKHPHARGEDVVHRLITRRNGETPPRTWGRPTADNNTSISGRNTPTHVGKTLRIFAPDKIGEKHPHARGEDGILGGNNCASVRNTPTHVGKTWHSRCGHSTWGKHPHARGEDAPEPYRPA